MPHDGARLVLLLKQVMHEVHCAHLMFYCMQHMLLKFACAGNLACIESNASCEDKHRKMHSWAAACTSHTLMAPVRLVSDQV